MFKIPFEGLVDQQQLIYNALTSGVNLRAFLFTNNHVPADGDSLGTYVQPTFTGYATVVLLTYSLPQIIGDRSVITAAGVQFMVTVASPPDSCYGWGVYDQNSGMLWGAELFAGGPINMQNPGDAILRYPVLTLKSEV